MTHVDFYVNGRKTMTVGYRFTWQARQAIDGAPHPLVPSVRKVCDSSCKCLDCLQAEIERPDFCTHKMLAFHKANTVLMEKQDIFFPKEFL